MGGWLQFERGEVRWGRRRRRNRGRECRQRGCVYNGFYQWNHWRNLSVGISIGDFVGDITTSLYGYLSLNLSVSPSVKSSEKTPRYHTIASFQTNFIGRRRSGRYIPTISPIDLCCRYIPTDFEMELFLSVIITDEKILSVIPLVFAGFLVVC
jgi:hypothetical protein